ncbi:C6 transcription factor [Fusarium pseudocircinatum]|uniref:C6 transcription factor n=1 Tax=Fusarium pseudocircinatum TaxID=56676 RepID=A0A8H5KIY7_9HYPO|nr:C6 transcription factor [Fusarium pseudocircinatum]
MNAKPAVRKKSVQACRSCRIGKRKCDSARPTCAACARRAIPGLCVYDRPGESRVQTARHLDALQKRIAELEKAQSSARTTGESWASSATLNHIQPQDLGSSSLGSVDGTINASIEVAAHQSVDLASIGIPDNASVTGSNEPSYPAERSISVNGSVQHSTLTFSDANSEAIEMRDYPDSPVTAEEIGVSEPRYGCYGDSSALGFMCQVRDCLDTRNEWSDPEDHQRQRPNPRRSPPSERTHSKAGQRRLTSNSTRSSEFQLFTVPSRPDADILMENYRKRVHTIYPFLDWAAVQRRYERIWSPTSMSSKRGSTWNGPPRHEYIEPQSESNLEDIASRKLLYCTLNTIFALGCQSDPYADPEEQALTSDMFWQRAKQLLELDFDVFNEGSVELVQCLLLVSLYHQSTGLSGVCWNVVSVAVRTAQTLGLHRYSPTANAPGRTREDSELRRTIWAGSIDLQDLQVSKPQVAAFVRKISSGDFQTLLQLDVALLRWRSNLPEALQPSTYGLSRDVAEDRTQDDQDALHLVDETLARQAVILQSRYLYIQILLFRPTLLKVLSSWQKRTEQGLQDVTLSSLHEKMLMHASETCISAAQELSYLLLTRWGGRKDLLPEWWVRLEESWNKILAGLYDFKHTRSARRCCKVLELADRWVRNGQSEVQAHQGPTPTEDLLQTQGKYQDTNGGASGPEHVQTPQEDLFLDMQCDEHIDDILRSWVKDPLSDTWLDSVPFQADI